MTNHGFGITLDIDGCGNIFFKKESVLELIKSDENLSPVYHDTIMALYDGPLQLGEVQDTLRFKLGSKKIISEDTLRNRFYRLVEDKIVTRYYPRPNKPYYKINLNYLLSLYEAYRKKNNISLKPGCEVFLGYIAKREKTDILLPPFSEEERQAYKTLDKKTKLKFIRKKVVEKRRPFTIEREIQEGERSCPPFKPNDILLIGKRTALGTQLQLQAEKLIDAIKTENPITKFSYFYKKELYRNKYLDKNGRALEDALIGDYNNFVLGGPKKEQEIRTLLWDSDLFHIIDMYDLSFDRFLSAKILADHNGQRFHEILKDSLISEGHILTHLNDLNGARQDFTETLNDATINDTFKARTCFRLGEIEIYQWNLDASITKFDEALDICEQLDKKQEKNSIQRIRADSLRRKGTSLRLKGNLDDCERCYSESELIYKKWSFRGLVWLSHGWAELFRARRDYKQSLETYELALKQSSRIFNINRVAHARLGMCEVYRLMRADNGDIDRKTKHAVEEMYLNAQNIYQEIVSNWGLSQVSISKALFNLSDTDVSDDSQEEMYNLLFAARKMCKHMGFKGEVELINRIVNKQATVDEINPLSFF